MDRVDGALGTQPNLFAPVSDTSAESVTGSYRGQEVKVEDPNSLLADAAEELTFAASEKVEKKLSERKQVDGRERVRDIDQIVQKVKEMKDLDPAKLKQLAERMKQAGANKDALKELLREAFKDPSHQHAALARAYEDLAGDPACAELRQAVGEMLAELEETQGPEIRAGYNIDAVDPSPVGTAQEGRDLYRQTVLGKADVAQTFTTLMDKYGPEGFKDALKFLIQAIGADVAAELHSMDESFLYAANSDLYQVEVLGNLYRDAEAMLDYVDRADPDGRGSGGGSKQEQDPDGEGRGQRQQKRALALMKDILRIKDSRILDSSAVRAFLELRGEAAPTRDVLLVKGVKDLVHKLPLKIYVDASTRQVVLNGVQALLDEVIAVEEASLADEEEDA